MAGFTVLETKMLVTGIPGLEILGHDQQMLHVCLSPGQSIWAEPGTMIHCDTDIKSTVGTGGCLQCLMRTAATGTGLRVHWTNTSEDPKSTPKVLGLAPNFPAKIIPMNLNEWNGCICSKYHSFLAAMDPSLLFSIGRYFMGGMIGLPQRKFDPENDVFDIIRGQGWIFLNASGAIMVKLLQAGETLVVDRKCVVAWESTVMYGYRLSGGIAMMVAGGEGLMETTLTGPGKVVVQSMPFEKTKALFRGNEHKG